MWPVFRRQSEFDWSRYFDLPPETRKERLIEECRRNNVSIHIDSYTETASGINAIFRPVASEAELERRLVAKLAIGKSTWANRIAGFSLLVSLISLTVSIWGK